MRYERQRRASCCTSTPRSSGASAKSATASPATARHAAAGAGWEFLHVCVDDHSRVAYVEMLARRDAPKGASAFLRRAVRWFRQQGVRIERVMTDNGCANVAHDFAAALPRARIRHLRTRPYTPRTNGKAERFIQTLLREWAYVRPYRSSNQRAKRLTPWLRYYNRQRPHSALRGLPPQSRIRRPR